MSLIALERALVTRLTSDATLNGLVGHGVWSGVRPTKHFETGRAKTWITFRVMSAVEEHRSPGRWKNAQYLIEAHAHASEGAGITVQIDDRIGELIHNWTPSITGWAVSWPAIRRYSVMGSYVFKRRVERYSYGSVYRFRFGET